MYYYKDVTNIEHMREILLSIYYSEEIETERGYQYQLFDV